MFGPAGGPLSPRAPPPPPFILQDNSGFVETRDTVKQLSNWFTVSCRGRKSQLSVGSPAGLTITLRKMESVAGRPTVSCN